MAKTATKTPWNDSFSADDKKEILALKEKILECTNYNLIPIGEENKKPAIAVAGGWFGRQLRGEKQNDIDFFVLDDPETRKKLDEFYSQFPSELVKENTDSPYFESGKVEKVITIQPILQGEQFIPVQVIYHKTKTLEELFGTFDYVHACIAYGSEKLTISPKSFYCAKNKLLVRNSEKEPNQSRTDKFLSEGYTVYQE